MAFRLARWVVLLICSTALLTAQTATPALGDPLRFKRVARITAMIGPRNDIQFSSRLTVGDRLTDFSRSPVALGPNGDMFIVTPTPDFRGSQIYRIINTASAVARF